MTSVSTYVTSIIVPSPLGTFSYHHSGFPSHSPLPFGQYRQRIVHTNMFKLFEYRWRNWIQQVMSHAKWKSHVKWKRFETYFYGMLGHLRGERATSSTHGPNRVTWPTTDAIILRSHELVTPFRHIHRPKPTITLLHLQLRTKLILQDQQGRPTRSLAWFCNWHGYFAASCFTSHKTPH